MSAIETVLAAAEARGEVKRVGAEFVTNCPAHPDENPSCHFHEMDNGNVVVKCRSRNCAFKDIAAGWGLAQRAFFPPKPERPKQKELGPCVATFLYELTHGKTAYKACRFQFPGSREKTFILFRPDGNGKWIADLKGVQRVPYRWPELLEADPSAPICILEGERKVDLVREKFGMVATCNFGGTGGSAQWKTPAFQKAVKGRDIIIIPDHDEPGEKYAATVAPAIVSVAKSVKIVRLPLKNQGDDVVQFIEAGGTREQLLALVEAAPLWTPAPAQPVAVDAVIAPGRDGHRPPRAFAMTETGGAELLADRLAGDWRYCHERAQWARWTGKVWTFDGGDVAITERSKQVAHEFLAEAQWALKVEDARAKAFAQFAASAQRRQFRRAVIDLARSEPGILIPFSEFDRDAYLLNCQNGTVDLKTGQLRPHCRENKITRILPWSYDPAATCPRWERFLTEILPDGETVDFVRHAIGYTVSGDVSEHVLFSCFGAGANGKSTLLNVLLYLFGPYGTTAPTSMLVAKQHESHPAEKMVLVNKWLVVFQEIPSGQRLNEALVKALVSGDPDQARGMRENFVEFRPVGKLWLAGNHRLDIREQTDAIWRRYREIPFERAFTEEERDHGLEETLRGEIVGILAWSVRACLEWQRVGLGKSGKVLAATADFRAEADRLGPFLGERCTVAPSATVPRSALYREYCAWAEAQGDRHPLGERQFADLLRGRGFGACWTRSNGKQCRGWRGLELATDNTNNTFPPDSPLPPISLLSREGSGKTGGNVLSPVVGKADAPDPLAQIGHCLRVRPDTTASDEDRQALAAHFSTLNGSAEATAQRLWTYWKGAPAPSVSEFLATERRGAPHA